MTWSQTLELHPDCSHVCEVADAHGVWPERACMAQCQLQRADEEAAQMILAGWHERLLDARP